MAYLSGSAAGKGIVNRHRFSGIDAGDIRRLGYGCSSGQAGPAVAYSISRIAGCLRPSTTHSHIGRRHLAIRQLRLNGSPAREGIGVMAYLGGSSAGKGVVNSNCITCVVCLRISRYRNGCSFGQTSPAVAYSISNRLFNADRRSSDFCFHLLGGFSVGVRIIQINILIGGNVFAVHTIIRLDFDPSSLLIFSYIANIPSKRFTVCSKSKFFRIIGNNFKLARIDNISQHSISASRDSIDLICPSFKDVAQLLVVICTSHINEVLILNIRSHILQIIRSIVFQCDTNGIHRNTSFFESRNLIRTIPVRII